MAELLVDLRTDFTRREFGSVELHLIKRDRARRLAFIDFVSIPAGDLLRGVRLATIHDLSDASYLLVTRLLDARGVPIAMRRTLVSLRGTFVTLVVIARPG